MAKKRNQLPVGWEIINVDQLVKAEWNYKTNDEKLQEKLINNLKRNGVILNINVREIDDGKYEVIDGNHRLDAMQKLNIKEVVARNHGKITLAQATRISIELNETQHAADVYKLRDSVDHILTEFDKDEFLETAPYDENEIDNLLNIRHYDLDGGDPSGIDDDDEESNFDFTIKVNVTKSTFEMWESWKEYIKSTSGWDNESKAFEFALIEAVNSEQIHKTPQDNG